MNWMDDTMESENETRGVVGLRDAVGLNTLASEDASESTGHRCATSNILGHLQGSVASLVMMLGEKMTSRIEESERLLEDILERCQTFA